MQLSMVNPTPTPPGYSGDFHLYTQGITLKSPYLWKSTTQNIPHLLIYPRPKLPYIFPLPQCHNIKSTCILRVFWSHIYNIT